MTLRPLDSAVFNSEPFGPLAEVRTVKSLDEAIAEANRMPFGGIKDSGYGSEGGPKALETHLSTKTVATTSVWGALP